MVEQGGESGAETANHRVQVTVTTSSWLEPDDVRESPEAGTGGRYLLLERLGAGGMGTVHAAYDRVLDRKIALKFVKSGGARDRTYQRVRREAQAMARLEHPGVVAVHDVGQLEDGTMFVAMELVDGQTLRVWLDEPRSWEQIRDVFLQAGQGLAAAHSVGLVHRDFKPDNVLVGRDDRVRVADFGLARETDPVEQDDGESAPRTGRRAVAGTPPYIAPERYARDAADPLADQFSFCVALHEALYGVHPFQGDSVESIRRSMEAGTLSAVPRNSGVPGWVRAVVLRGLSPDPADRFPSMAALLQALSSDPRRRRRRALAAGAAVVGALAVVAGLAHAQRTRSLVCRGAERKLAGVWDASIRGSVRSAFLATGLPFAAAAADDVTRTLDRYTAQLVAAHVDACESAQIRREQSAAVQDLRMACIDQRLVGAGALTALLAKANASAVEQAARAVSGLPAVADCANVAALQAPLALPSSPAARERIGAIRAHVAEAAAARRLVRNDQALALGERALADAHASGYLPVEAEALLEVGRVRESMGAAAVAEQRYREAVAAAEASHHDAVMAQAATFLILDVGMTQARPAEGRWWATLAAAAVQRAAAGAFAQSEVERSLADMELDAGRLAEAGPHLDRAVALFEASGHHDLFEQVRLLLARGRVATRAGQAQEATDRYRQAIALIEAELPGHPQLARAHYELAGVAYDLGRYDEAVGEFQRALAIDVPARGADHPSVGTKHLDYGLTLQAMGRTDQALEELTTARKILDKAYGPNHRRSLEVRAMIAYSLSMKGNFRDALRELDEVIPPYRRVVEPDSANLADLLGTVANVSLRAGRLDDARRAAEEDVAIVTKTSAPDPHILGSALIELAATRVAQGAAADGLAHAERAASVLTRAYGADQIDVAVALGVAGHARLALGQREQARATLERAVAIFDRRRPIPTEGFAARFRLAQLLGGGERARDLARRALADLTATGMDPRLLAEVERWLRNSRPPKP